MPQGTMRRLFSSSEGLEPNRYVIARYRISAANDQALRESATRLALLTALGTVDPLPIETLDARFEHGPRILEASHFAGQSFGEATIAVPLEIIGTNDIVAMLLNTLLFSAEYNFVKDIRLRSIDLPDTILDQIDGPTFGTEGLREVTQVWDRPMLTLIMKPRAGVPLKALHRIVYDALVGGVDIVMDDELVVDPSNEQHFDARVAMLVDAAHRAESFTGERKSVAINVTGRPSLVRWRASAAYEAGAHILVINAFTCGTTGLLDLVEADAGMPVLACNVGSGVVTRAAVTTGIDSSVYCRLHRLAGADGVQTGILAANAYTTDVWGPSVVALESPLRAIRPATPIVAGGLNVANLWANWSGVGDNSILAAGYSVLAYPQGPSEGARAMRTVLQELDPDMSPSDAGTTLLRLGARSPTTLGAGLDAFGFHPQSSVGLDADD